jgi:hypothetical protein
MRQRRRKGRQPGSGGTAGSGASASKDLEYEHSEQQLTGGIVGMRESHSEASVGRGGLLTQELRMRTQDRHHLRKHGGELAPAVEHDERELRVTPGGVAEKLVNGPAQRLLPRPELALRDEERATRETKNNVGLPGEVERPGACLTSEEHVEGHEEMVSQVLLGHSLKCRRCALEHGPIRALDNQ